ncbi:MAG TPA: outer membrane protein assembly factor BamD [Thermodesulfobacteriota bacterium]|nr:outer membrane protein assembly factor BamD [Thermodesulfobacteriota bacterium]
MRKLLLLNLITLTLIIGCGSKKPIEGNNAKAMYDKALEELSKDKGGFFGLFNATDYGTIEETLKEIQIRYTYSPYATLAELRTADTYFKRGEYEQAAIEYEEFIKRHPSHNGTEYATFFLALCNFKSIRGHDRDPSGAREAVKWLNEYIEQYPDSPLVQQAHNNIRETIDVLAEREIYIGDYYYNKNNFKASSERYKTVIDQYPQTTHYAKALYLLGKSYSDMNENSLALSALNRVINEFPNSKYNKDALELASRIK